MIITTHELYDFYYLITVIRNEITDKNNIYILKKVTDLYKNGVEEIDDNRLRKLMISLNICDDKWSVLCYENRYSQESGLLKDKEKIEFLNFGKENIYIPPEEYVIDGDTVYFKRGNFNFINVPFDSSKLFST